LSILPDRWDHLEFRYQTVSVVEGRYSYRPRIA